MSANGLQTIEVPEEMVPSLLLSEKAEHLAQFYERLNGIFPGDAESMRKQDDELRRDWHVVARGLGYKGEPTNYGGLFEFLFDYMNCLFLVQADLEAGGTPKEEDRRKATLLCVAIKVQQGSH